MPHRRPLKWPNGARLALIMTLNLEYWDLVKDDPKTYYAGGPAILPDPLPGNVADYPNYTWREYGHRVGVWRVMDLFEKHGIKGSATMNAKLALERPEIVKGALDLGWELIAHNYEQGELLTNHTFEPEKERELIRRTLQVYEQTVGRKAAGWLSSSLRSTPNTSEIVAEEGLKFFCDLMNDDQPYLIHTKARPLVSIPYTNEINDFTVYLRRDFTADEVAELLKDHFDVLYEEGKHSGRIMNVGLHPHVIGQPYRLKAIDKFLKHVRKHDGVWTPRREEIADWYLQHHAEHIPPRASAGSN
jgi:peptidoglycan/xylan/chitin deacetylase (PgdA/CDA1 family)